MQQIEYSNKFHCLFINVEAMAFVFYVSEAQKVIST